MSNAAVKAVDIRHWTCGWAMTLGASTMAAEAAAATTPPAVAMNLRRSVITLPSSHCHELMVGAFGHVVPRAHQRLELREGCVHLPGHGSLLGFFPDDLRRQLPEIAQHRNGKLDYLDLPLELRPESPERDRVLGVVVREAINLDCRGGMIERPPQIDRERLVCLLVETEVLRAAWLVPARVVVVLRGPVETELHVVMRSDPFGGVDDAPFKGTVDLVAWNVDRRAARSNDDLAAEGRAHAHLEPLVIADRVDLLPEPSGHLRGKRYTWARHEIEAAIRFLPELEPITLVVPGGHALGIHAERDRTEPLEGGLLVNPVLIRSHERLDLALGGGVEARKRRHDLLAWEHLDPEPPAARLLDRLRQSLGHALVYVKHRGVGRGHPPLNLRLSDDVGGVDNGGGGSGCHHPARRRDEPAPLSHPAVPSPRDEPMRIFSSL